MEKRKEGVSLVRDCLLFVLKKKKLEPDLVKIDLQSLLHVLQENLSDPVEDWIFINYNLIKKKDD